MRRLLHALPAPPHGEATASPAAAGEADRVAIGHEVTVKTSEDFDGDVVVIGAVSPSTGGFAATWLSSAERCVSVPTTDRRGRCARTRALEQAAAAAVAGSTVGVDGTDAAARILGKAESPNRASSIGEHSTALKVGRVVGWAASSSCSWSWALFCPPGPSGPEPSAHPGGVSRSLAVVGGRVTAGLSWCSSPSPSWAFAWP